MRKHRLDDLLRVPLVAEDGCALLGMLVEGGVDLVVEVMKERGATPELDILAEACGIEPHRGLHRERMP